MLLYAKRFGQTELLSSNTYISGITKLTKFFSIFSNPTPDENHYLTVTWLPVTKDNQYYLNLGSELSLSTSPDKEKMEFWENLYSKHFRIWEHPKTNTEEVLPVKYDPPVIVDSVIESMSVFSSSHVTHSSEVITERTEVITESSEVVDSNEVTEVSETTAEVSEPTVEFVEVENVVENPVVDEPKPRESAKFESVAQPASLDFSNHLNGERKARTSNEIKMVSNANGAPKDVIRANDPPEDDLPKNIGVNKFVNFFESLGGKK